MKKANTAHNLILFHLMGQHVNYRQRYPKGRGVFRGITGLHLPQP